MLTIYDLCLQSQTRFNSRITTRNWNGRKLFDIYRKKKLLMFWIPNKMLTSIALLISFGFIPTSFYLFFSDSLLPRGFSHSIFVLLWLQMLSNQRRYHQQMDYAPLSKCPPVTELNVCWTVVSTDGSRFCLLKMISLCHILSSGTEE